MAEQTELKTSTGTPSGQPGMPDRPTGGGGGMSELLVMLVPMILIFYFVFIRPENKRRREKEALLGGIKAKDKVVTIGGLFGTVVEIDGDEIVLQVDSKRDVKLRFRRSAIDSVVRAEEKAEEKEKK